MCFISSLKLKEEITILQCYQKCIYTGLKNKNWSSQISDKGNNIFIDTIPKSAFCG